MNWKVFIPVKNRVYILDFDDWIKRYVSFIAKGYDFLIGNLVSVKGYETFKDHMWQLKYFRRSNLFLAIFSEITQHVCSQ